MTTEQDADKQDFTLARQLFHIIFARNGMMYGEHILNMVWELEQDSLVWREMFGDITKVQLQRMAELLKEVDVHPLAMPPLNIRKD